jgi:hypothetical protein
MNTPNAKKSKLPIFLGLAAVVLILGLLGIFVVGGFLFYVYSYGEPQFSKEPVKSSTPEPRNTPATSDADVEPDLDEERPSGDLNQQAEAFMEKYLDERMANCGDSYYLWTGKGFFQTKVRPYVRFGHKQINPARPATEADRLNGRQGSGETWYGTWYIKVESPWRIFDNTYRQWKEWRNDTLDVASSGLNYTANGVWDTHEGSSPQGLKELEKYKCVGDDFVNVK